MAKKERLAVQRILYVWVGIPLELFVEHVRTKNRCVIDDAIKPAEVDRN